MGIRELPSVSIMLATSEEQIRAAKRLELDLFRDVGYVAYQDADEVKEFEPYNAASTFYIAVAEGKIVGVLRTIRYSAAGFATLHDFPVEQRWTDLLIQQAQLGRVEEIGPGVVTKPYRALYGFAVLRGLMRTAWQDALSSGIRWWIALVDHRVTRLLRQIYRWDLKLLSAPQFFMGSLTEAVVLDLHREALTLPDRAPSVAADLFQDMDPDKLAAILQDAQADYS